MKTFTAAVVTETLTIQAVDHYGAEQKYSLFYDGANCPDHPDTFVGNCCVEHSDSDVYHDMEELND